MFYFGKEFPKREAPRGWSEIWSSRAHPLPHEEKNDAFPIDVAEFEKRERDRFEKVSETEVLRMIFVFSSGQRISVERPKMETFEDLEDVTIVQDFSGREYEIFKTKLAWIETEKSA